MHKESNHPPNIIKQISLSIETRLSNLSSNEAIFKESVPYYETALKNSGYNHKFKYNPTNRTPQSKNKNRKRNIIWCNPPYNSNVTTNVGKYFLNLLKIYFPKDHKLNKIFNKNNVKISYSCMPNMESIITAHNKNIMYKNDTPLLKTCNCL